MKAPEYPRFFSWKLPEAAYARARCLRPPVPVHFPTDELVPETKRHLLVRTALFDVLTIAYGHRAAVGSDQFVYWNARDPKACLAPDVMVRLGQDNDIFRSWKTWERGAPHVAVEILSEPGEMEPKLEKYNELGVHELVAFDPDDTEAPLRLWGRVDDDLVEQTLVDARTAFSPSLEAFWVVVEDERTGTALRLSVDAAGADLLPTRAEREAKALASEVKAREAEVKAREAAELRVRELEAELARRGRD